MTITRESVETSEVVAAPVAEAPSGIQPLALFALLIGLFLPITDFFVVNVALPRSIPICTPHRECCNSS